MVIGSVWTYQSNESLVNQATCGLGMGIFLNFIHDDNIKSFLYALICSKSNSWCSKSDSWICSSH